LDAHDQILAIHTCFRIQWYMLPFPVFSSESGKNAKWIDFFTRLYKICTTLQIELYSTSWCGYCKKARRFFRSRGIPFTEYDIEKDKNAARRKKELGSPKGVPFVVIDGQGIQGYAEAAYETALNR